MKTYTITFEGVRRTCGGREWLCFPGRHGRRHGPYKNRQEAWEQYVRIARELHFHFEPEKPIVYEESDPPPYVPPADFQI